MKSCLVIIVSLTLITNTQCGLVDGFFGTVKDTTSSITHSIGGAVHYGKSLVFGSEDKNATAQTITKPGIIGTISMKIHVVSQTVREKVQTAISMFDKNQNGKKGYIGRFLDRMNSRIVKMKSFLFGHNLSEIENQPNAPVKLGNDTKVLCEKLRKYFFKNNTSQSTGIRETLSSFQDAIEKIRNNITKHRQDSGNNGNNEEDGEGLMDIRTSVNNLGGLQADFVNGMDAAYDKVEDGINEGRGKAKAGLNTFKESTNDFIENQRRNVQNNINHVGDRANTFRNDVDNSINDMGSRIKDESDKVKDLMENAYK